MGTARIEEHETVAGQNEVARVTELLDSPFPGSQRVNYNVEADSSGG